MKQITINVEARSGVGRSANRRLRGNGKIPAVVYGESGVESLQIDAHQFALAWRKIAGSAALLELHTEGKEENKYAIIQDAQRDARSDAFVHVDFKEIVRGKDMEASIPVHAVGISNGVKNFGGVLELPTSELSVRCRPRDLPEFIEVDVTNLGIGDSIHLRDLTPPEGVTFLDDDSIVVAACVGSSGGREAAAAEGAESEAAASSQA